MTPEARWCLPLGVSFGILKAAMSASHEHLFYLGRFFTTWTEGKDCMRSKLTTTETPFRVLISAVLKGLVLGVIAGLALGFAFGLIPLPWSTNATGLTFIFAQN